MIKISNADIGYGEVLLKKINLSFDSGQLIMLCGENGTGKSTFIESITGKTPLLSGAIYFNGEAVKNAERSGLVSICYPLISTYGNLTFFDLVLQGRSRFTGIFDKPSSDDLQIVDKHMTDLGIDHLKHQLMTKASDGERQKALLARALSSETPVILLDEPTAFLDYPSKKNLMRILKTTVSENNRLVIFTSHDLELCRPFVDEIALIHNKSILSSNNSTFNQAWAQFIQ